MRSWEEEYPRPQLRRDSFLPLHRGWTMNGEEIQVPWPPQAELSGYNGKIGDNLRYRCEFTVPDGFVPEGFRVVLHIGAADQTARVILNGTELVRHEGGYLPFSADLTPVLRRKNELVVQVRDTLSTDYPYGKQCRRPHGMWYTPVSGIWQSVWLEAVPGRDAVTGLRITPDLTGITLDVETEAACFFVEIPRVGLKLQGNGGSPLRIEIPDPQLWTPERPFLYDLVVSTETDTVRSYFALRTMTLETSGGYTRLCLNGKPVFLNGVLDQGYYPGGFFLPESPEVYEQDIQRMKALGYNTLRKHIKVEPEAFYAACDRLGMLVLQDMVNSGPYRYIHDTVLPTFGYKQSADTGLPVTAKRKALFERHVQDTLRHLYSHPCVVGYTIFNEGWGQYDSDRIYGDCKRADPSRFFVSTSGWFAQNCSDVQSEHIYFRNEVLRSSRPGQALFLSECGGFSWRVPGHVEEKYRNYGYGKQEENRESLTRRICGLYREMVLPSIPNGLCGCIYTQLSDVEGETNGLYTFDREVCKAEGHSLRSMAEDIQILWKRVLCSEGTVAPEAEIQDGETGA